MTSDTPIPQADATKRYTYQDYLEMPDDDGLTRQVIEGELFVTLAPVPFIKSFR